MLSKNQSPKESFARYVRTLQNEICRALEALDGEAVFIEDQWDRDGGGGGWTRIMDGGRLFEKAGVNVSAVHGTTPEVIKNQVPESAAEFYATGISLVIHPINPMIPTVHANFRFFQLMDTEGNIVDGWFGGGADLTPYYLFEEDAVHFHQTLKDACDRHDPSHYPKF
ncbi:MAG: coproporphyrinogen III oxidase, partial [Bacteroidota bacterium]|nr:coproporphyrinogen III oxidase [Bacteroidota bacterium]